MIDGNFEAWVSVLKKMDSRGDSVTVGWHWGLAGEDQWSVETFSQERTTKRREQAIQEATIAAEEFVRRRGMCALALALEESFG